MLLRLWSAGPMDHGIPCSHGNRMQHSVILGTQFIFNTTKSQVLLRRFSNEKRVKRYCCHLNHISLNKWSEIWVGCYAVTISFQAVDCWTWNHTTLQFNKVTRKLKTKPNPFSPQLGLALHGLMWQHNDSSCARRGLTVRQPKGGRNPKARKESAEEKCRKVPALSLVLTVNYAFKTYWNIMAQALLDWQPLEKNYRYLLSS